MSLHDVLTAASERGVLFYLKDGKLAYKAKKGALTSELKASIVAQKSEIIAYLNSNDIKSQQSILPPIEKSKEQHDVLPLSYAQQRLWFVNQLQEDSLQYNLSGNFLLQGELHRDAFENALCTLFERHEVLRVCFKELGGEPVQQVQQDFDLPLTWCDLSELTETEKQQQLEELVIEESRKAFDLSRDLMLRMILVKLSATQYFVVYTLHHIAGDGWSRSILQKELSTLYDAFRHDKPNPLTPLELQYSDYALWQRNWLAGDVLNKSLDYWKLQLADLPTVHGLPLDKPRPVKLGSAGGMVTTVLNKATVEKIGALCQKYNITLFIFMHTVLALLLSRHSNEKDIVIGSAMTGRSHQQVEGLIGLFINDLVLRLKFTGNPGFEALLEQHKHTILDAYSHQHVPFELLVETLNPQRSLSHSPLYQVKLDIQNNEQSRLALSDMDIVDVREHARHAQQSAKAESAASDNGQHNVKHDLYLSVTQGEDSIAVNWRYSTELFFHQTVERLAENFETLLSSVLEDPQKTVLELKIQSPQQERSFLPSVTKSHRFDNGHCCLHHLFERQVANSPQATAATWLHESISYEQLNEQANQLAHYLIQAGVRPDALLAICLERSLDMVVTILAVLKSGGAYVPLDPKAPQHRIAKIIEDCNCKLVLTQTELMSELSFGDKRILPVDAQMRANLLAKFDKSNPTKKETQVTSDNLAYVIYTSGSTGTPKGVSVQHKALQHYCDCAREMYYPIDSDGSLVATSYSFDLTAPSLYLPLLQGDCVNLLPEGNEIEELASALKQSSVSYLLRLTPSHIDGLVTTFAGIGEPDHAAGLQTHTFVLGGEPLAVSTVAAIRKYFPKSYIFNHYGPTESVIGCSIYAVPSALAYPQQPFYPIGQAMHQTRLLVLNDAQQICPVGVTGELYVGGPVLASGYLNQPELTAQKFVNNPFDDDDCDRLYKTGDLVRWLPDEKGKPGNLLFVGRVDNQVKVRGLRIELGEIEQALLSIESAVASAVSVCTVGNNDEQHLVAYVVANQETKNRMAMAEDEAELIQCKDSLIHQYRNELGNQLPEYMIPQIYIFLNTLPLTAAGKLNSKALPAPQETDLLKSRYVAPQNDIEAKVCQLWQEILQLERVGIEDNFFLLGGHSLLATRLINYIRRDLSVDLPLRVVFESPTVAEMSRCVVSMAQRDTMPQILPIARGKPIPLSYAQQRLWFIDQLGDGSQHYNVSGRLFFGEEFDGESFSNAAFEHALGELLARHEVLTTHFEMESGQAKQVIRKDAELPLSHKDFSHLAEPDLMSALESLLREEKQRAFNLDSDLMLRVVLVKLTDRSYMMLYTMHHIACDGWSRSILEKEFTVLYQAHRDGQPVPLTPLTVQYADYAQWQRDWLHGEELDSQLNYWREQLAGLPTLHSIPLDKPRPEQQSFSGKKVNQFIDRELTKQISDLCKSQEVTLFILFQTVFALLLSRYSNKSDIVMGTPVSGRTREEVEGLIGLFVNSLVLRTDLSQNSSFSELLNDNKQMILDAHANQHIPFEMLVEQLSPERDLAYNPVFQVMLVFPNNQEREFSFKAPKTLIDAGRSAKDDAEQQRPSALRTDLDLYVVTNGTEISMTFKYNDALFDDSTITVMSQQFVSLLQNIMQDPEQKTADIYLDNLDALNSGTIATQPYPLDARVKYPLSYHQERLWFIDKFERGTLYDEGPTYHNVPIILEISGKLAPELVEQRVNQVLNTSGVLKSVFTEVDDTLTQSVMDDVNIKLHFEDALPTLLTGENLLERCIQDSKQSFDISDEPLIRASLYQKLKNQHILLLSIHHMLVDRKSVRVLAQQLAYSLDKTQQISELSDNTEQHTYLTYAQAQRHNAELGNQYKAQMVYWRGVLRDKVQALELPCDYPRKAIHEYEEGRLQRQIPLAIVGLVEYLASGADVDEYSILLAAFKTLLRVYTRQDEIVVGVMADIRDKAESKPTMGPLSNLLVTRDIVRAQDSFESVLEQVDSTLDGARRYKDIPFDLLVQNLALSVDMSRTALFDVLFHFEDENEYFSEYQGAECRVTQLETNLGYGKYDLNILLQKTEQGYALNVVYNKGLHHATTINRLFSHFETLLESVLTRPEQQVQQIQLLSAQEVQQQIQDWNAAIPLNSRDLCVFELFEHKVRHNPDAVALVCQGAHLTYKALNERANQLAHCLRANGVVAETLVGLSTERSLEMVIGILGIMKAGGAYVSLDPVYPAERISYILQDSGVELVVAQEKLASLFTSETPNASHKLIFIDRTIPSSDERCLQKYPVTNIATQLSGVQSTGLAYVIYTSGSTGKPKGVLVEHANVRRLFQTTEAEFGFSGADIWTLVHSFAFDFSVWEIWGALLYGGKLVLVPATTAQDTEDFYQLLVTECVTVLNQTPAMFNQVIEVDKRLQLPLSLQTVIFGGEALDFQRLRPWFEMHDDQQIRLYNMYGITETTVHTTCKRVQKEDTLVAGGSNIGKKLGDLTLYLLDNQMSLVPRGVTAEIYVGGPGVTRGYLNRDELTAARFITNPFNPKERLYRSGDLACYNLEGELIYKGRSDFQVKLRGFRIEPGEIEGALLQHDCVAEAHVMVREDVPEQQLLVAYIVSSKSISHTQELGVELRAFAQSKLPAYMIPATIVLMDALPLTASGKMDVKSLPVPDMQSKEVDYCAPKTDLQRRLCDIWQQVLKVDRVGIQDNFFTLGGHSLLATRLVSAVRQEFDVEIPIRALFESPTVLGLSQSFISEQQELLLPPVRAVKRNKPLPLSYAQQRLWFVDQLGGGSVEYNMQGQFMLAGELDKDKFRSALKALINRHEVLKTVFATSDGQAYQVILESFDIPVVFADLAVLTPDERSVQVNHVIRNTGREPFDLSSNLPLRVQVLSLSDKEHMVAYSLHHIAGDGWSLNILKDELNTLYLDLLNSEKSSLETLEVQYVDYASWQRDWLQGEVLDSQLSYWKDKLIGLPPVHSLPLDQPRPAQQSFEGKAFSQLLSKAISNRIITLCRDKEITLFMFLETAFSLLLSRYSGEKDIVVGSPIAGRAHQDLEGLIGLFVNSLVLRTNVDGEMTFSELLDANKKTILDAYAHQHTPFEMLVEEIRPERDMSYNSLFQILFVLQNNEKDVGELTQLVSQTEDNALFAMRQVSIRFDLALHVTELDDNLIIRWSYRDYLFADETVSRMANNFSVLLSNIVEILLSSTPEPRLQDINILSTQEKNMLLEDWKGQKVSHCDNLCIHEIFEQQAQHTPDHIAIIFEDMQLSYEQLNRRANQLAHYLVAQGVTPDSIVALKVERSLDTMVAMLGILKAGAGYVALEAKTPPTRLNYILRDCGAIVMVTQLKLKETAGVFSGKTICIDDSDFDLELKQYPQTNLDTASVGVNPDNLAYVIFTSGSTGQPKGVMVNHRSVANFLHSIEKPFLMAEMAGSIVSSSLTFDATVQSLYLPLMSGKHVEFLPENDLLISTLADYLVDDDEALLFKITPSHLTAVANLGIALHNPEVKHVIVIAGEMLDQKNLAPWLSEYLPNATFFNEYGPTEATVGSCIYRAQNDVDYKTSGHGVPIGKPLDNVEFYVLDDNKKLMPIGAIGELYIGGAGLARAYLNKPEMTDNRFVSNPYQSAPGERLYKTGDMVRWLPDGNIEFIGRIDDQIKIRGFRIELGEIESMLSANELLDTSVVTVDEGDRLIAYVCPSTEYLDAAAAFSNEEHLEQWTLINDNKYAESMDEAEQAELNFGGWNSSYTDQPIDLSEMEEWVTETCNRIVALKPKSLLEIGCGQGLLLNRYGGICQTVTATDISSVALRGVQNQLDKRGWEHVHLQLGDALSLDEFNEHQFDTVVLNSVAQYFPNQLYLEQVISKILYCLQPGGKIFIGDIRNLDLFNAHVTAIEQAHLTQSTSIRALSNRVQRRQLKESELLISPSFFGRLGSRFTSVGDADIVVKRGVADNELLRYRYDVTITKSDACETHKQTRFEWFDYSGFETLHTMLTNTHATTFGVSGVPNHRIVRDVELSRGLTEWEGERIIHQPLFPGKLDADALEEVRELERLMQAAEKMGYRCAGTWSQEHPGQLDLLFSKSTLPAIQARSPYTKSALCNYPQLTSLGRDISDTLQNAVSEYLPDYMIPRTYVVMERLPMTSSGKIDKKALPKPNEDDLHKDQYLSPETEVEEKLCQIWQELLSIEQVGILDNFFALGGHSLLATRLISSIRQVFNIELPLRTLFESPTIVQLAEAISEQNEELVLPPVTCVAKDQPLLLSFAQQRLWFIDQMDEGSAQYNMPGRYLVTGDFDLLAFEKAVQALLQRHEVLRTHFTTVEGEVRQVISGQYKADVKLMDLSQLSEHEKAVRVQQLISEDYAKAFDLNRDLMLRTQVVKLSEQEHLILYTMHHIASDGWSVGILRNELSKLYVAFKNGQDNPLPPLKVQYADYAVWQRDWMQGQVLEEATSYWQKQLRDLPELHRLPLDNPRPKKQTYTGKSYRQFLNRDISNRINTLCEQHEVTLFMFLETAFAVLLGRYSNETDIVVGTPTAGRNHGDLEPLIGFFINTIVLRTDLSDDPTFAQLLQRNKEVILDAFAHQHMPFEMLVDSLNQERNMSHNPVTQILFVVQNNERGTLQLQEQNTSRSTSHLQQPTTKIASIKFDLEVNVHEQGDSLSVSWGYNDALFEDSSIAAMADSYCELLHSIAASLETGLIDPLSVDKEVHSGTLPKLQLMKQPASAGMKADAAQLVLQKEACYWYKHLLGLPQNLCLPISQQRAESYRPGQQVRVLRRDLSIRLQSFSRRLGVSFQTTLLSGLAILLSRYSKQTDVLITTGGQPSGLLSGTQVDVPVRMDVSKSRYLVDLLQETKQNLASGEENIDSTWQNILPLLLVNEGESHCILRQVRLVLKNRALPLNKATNHQKSNIYDIDFELTENMAGLKTSVTYNAARFADEFIEKLLLRFEGLLRAAVNSPEERIAALELAETRLSRLPITQPSVPKHNEAKPSISRQRVEQLFAAQARKTPDGIALSYQQQQWTYSELQEQSDALAQKLSAFPLNANSPVAILTAHCQEQLLAILGVLKAGGCFQLLDAGAPLFKVLHCLELSQPDLILCNTASVVSLNKVAKKTPTADACVYPLILDLSELLMSAPDDSVSEVKGCAALDSCDFNHRDVACAVINQYGIASVRNDESSALGISHHALTNMAQPARADGNSQSAADPGATRSYIKLSADLSWFRELLNGSGISIDSFAGNGSENKVAVPVANESKCFSDVMLTSNNQIVCEHLVGDQREAAGTISPAVAVASEHRVRLKSFEHTKCYLVNQSGTRVPDGAIGDLYIDAGDLSDGFYAQAGLTAQTFVPHPFSECPGQRLYRTGLIARVCVDGTIELLQRNSSDTDSKLLSAEVDALQETVKSCAAVQDVVIVGESRDKLVTYVVMDNVEQQSARAEDNQMLVREIQRNLRQHFPLSLLPREFISLEKIPLDAQGKVDHEKLPAPKDPQLRRTQYVAPKTDVQTMLCQLWQQELKVDRVGIYDNFFALGGHSLVATRLVSAIREELEIELQIRVLFESPDIASLSEAIAAGDDEFVLPSITPTERQIEDAQDTEELEF